MGHSIETMIGAKCRAYGEELPIDWPRACGQAPALLNIAIKAHRARIALKPHENIWLTYEELKAELSQHVGWDAHGSTQMRSSKAYDAVLAAISRCLGVR
jgi:hypothetical protein